MPSLKSIKLRIKSVKSTQKITKAMQMVAASKLKRAREAAENSADYAAKLGNLVKALAIGIDKSASNHVSLLQGTGHDKVHMLLVITSDRGLCGSFNHALCKLVKASINKLEAEGKEVKIVCVGKRGFDILKTEHKNIIVQKYENLVGKGGLKYEKAHLISEYLISEFEAGSFDCLTMFFSKFKSAISQIPTEKAIIPLEIDEEGMMLQHGCEYEPSEEVILEKLLPKNITVQIYTALLESISGEQAARMTAMDSATRNSGEMIKKLQLVYNRTRQAYITRELIEIISGAEAV